MLFLSVDTLRMGVFYCIDREVLLGSSFLPYSAKGRLQSFASFMDYFLPSSWRCYTDNIYICSRLIATARKMP